MTAAENIIRAEEALPGRPELMAVPAAHYVNYHSLKADWQPPLQVADFAMGCFWGAERLFWQLPGVYVTAAGYAGGFTPNPTYDEVCSGRTGHTETVRVVYDSRQTNLAALLRAFWENHDPTQYMRQGNDIGSNYRSAVYLHNEADYQLAVQSRAFYAKSLREEGRSGAGGSARAVAESGCVPITTEIKLNQPFYYAEACHQQYLAKNPDGYCGLKGTGVACPIPAAKAAGPAG